MNMTHNEVHTKGFPFPFSRHIKDLVLECVTINEKINQLEKIQNNEINQFQV